MCSYATAICYVQLWNKYSSFIHDMLNLENINQLLLDICKYLVFYFVMIYYVMVCAILVFINHHLSHDTSECDHHGSCLFAITYQSSHKRIISSCCLPNCHHLSITTPHFRVLPSSVYLPLPVNCHVTLNLPCLLAITYQMSRDTSGSFYSPPCLLAITYHMSRETCQGPTIILHVYYSSHNYSFAM